MFKRLIKSAFVAQLAAFVIGAYLRLVFMTSRWEFIGREIFDEAAAGGNGVIVAFWHGRLMLSPRLCSETGRQVHMLISSHRDGDIIAGATRSFGVDFIRGSAVNPKKPDKNKRGASAVAQIITALNAGGVVGVTPDGPRGPAEMVQPGVIKLAQLSGAPIIPVALTAARGKRLKSWDRFFFAAPFNRGIFMAGPAIRAPSENDAETVETTRRKLENALKSVNHQADGLVGRDDANLADTERRDPL